MFIGHFAVGFASKKIAPKASLGPLMAAPLLLDLLWPLFLLAGWERVRLAPGDTPFTPLEFVSYPWSHSLLAAAFWAALFAFGYFALSRYREGAVVIAAGVWLYLSVTRPRDRAGTYGFWSLVLFLAVAYAGAAQGIPPPSVRALALVGAATWLFPFWAAWLDAHRAVVFGPRKGRVGT